MKFAFSLFRPQKKPLAKCDDAGLGHGDSGARLASGGARVCANSPLASGGARACGVPSLKARGPSDGPRLFALPAKIPSFAFSLFRPQKTERAPTPFGFSLFFNAKREAPKTSHVPKRKSSAPSFGFSLFERPGQRTPVLQDWDTAGASHGKRAGTVSTAAGTVSTVAADTVAAARGEGGE